MSQSDKSIKGEKKQAERTSAIGVGVIILKMGSFAGTNITDKEILRKLKSSETFIPPLTVADQQALLFLYRSSLHVCLILLERLAARDITIKRMAEGNAELSRIIEDWIIKNPTKKTTL
jgi:hypothetical protein